MARQAFYRIIADAVDKAGERAHGLGAAIKQGLWKEGIPSAMYLTAYEVYLLTALARKDPGVEKAFYDFFLGELERSKEHHHLIALCVLTLDGMDDLLSLDLLQAWNSRKTPGVYTHLTDHIYYLSISDYPLLLCGETGTSKELLVDAIHKMGSRRDKNLYKINCAALPGSLIESELFGYEKGAFTGANRQKKGQLELAPKGTIFLDELGKMPLELQAKLLRAIETKRFARVGGEQETPFDVRFIGAVQPRDLSNKGQIYPDLLFRLGHPDQIELPPLRERLQVMPDRLLENALGRVCKGSSPVAPGTDSQAQFKLDDSASAKLLGYDYPGNYRELLNLLRAAVRSASIKGHTTISAQDLGLLDELHKKQEERDGDQLTRLLKDRSRGTPLSKIVEDANDIKALMVEEKVRNVRESGQTVKQVLQKEMPEMDYSGQLKKLQRAMRKKLTELRTDRPR